MSYSKEKDAYPDTQTIQKTNRQSAPEKGVLKSARGKDKEACFEFLMESVWPEVPKKMC